MRKRKVTEAFKVSASESAVLAQYFYDINNWRWSARPARQGAQPHTRHRQTTHSQALPAHAIQNGTTNAASTPACRTEWLAHKATQITRIREHVTWTYRTQVAT